MSCILFHFYIKPQHFVAQFYQATSCILFHFYIKPQLQRQHFLGWLVVSYSISTSNHNRICCGGLHYWLYLIPFLHQTTTLDVIVVVPHRCILFHFYIKPQHLPPCRCFVVCCILFHFYIKPQLLNFWSPREVSCILFHFYIKPQPEPILSAAPCVVSYSISTSNHNNDVKRIVDEQLYLIPFLHQTTTRGSQRHR